MAAAVVNTTRQTAAAGRLTRTSSDDPFSSRACQYDAQIHPDGAGAGAGADDSPGQRRSRARRDSIIEVEKVAAHLSRMRGGPLVISPDDKWVAKWDCCTSVALLFTAVFTPYETVLLPTVRLNLLFCVNRLVDLVFMCDLVMQFFLAYRLPTKDGGGLVRELPKIRRHYLTGWFVIDFVSILPLDVIALTNKDDAQKENVSRFKAMRLVRLDTQVHESVWRQDPRADDGTWHGHWKRAPRY